MRTIVVAEGQSLIDIAMQELGSADGLTRICGLNDLEFDADLLAGQSLLLPDMELDNDVQTYFKSKGVQVNTHLANTTNNTVIASNDDEPLVDNEDNMIAD